MMWKLEFGRDLPNWTWMYGKCEADDSGLDFRNLCTFGALDMRGVVPRIPWRLDMATENGLQVGWEWPFLYTTPNFLQGRIHIILLSSLYLSWEDHYIVGLWTLTKAGWASVDSKQQLVLLKLAVFGSWRLRAGGNFWYSCGEEWYMTVPIWNGCWCILPNSFWILWIHLYQILSCPSR